MGAVNDLLRGKVVGVAGMDAGSTMNISTEMARSLALDAASVEVDPPPPPAPETPDSDAALAKGPSIQMDIIAGIAAVALVVIMGAYMLLAGGKESKVAAVAPPAKVVAPTTEKQTPAAAVKSTPVKTTASVPPAMDDSAKKADKVKVEAADKKKVVKKAPPKKRVRSKKRKTKTASISPSKSKNLKMIPRFLSTYSDSKQAEVFIGNKFLGPTPINNLKFPQGEHTIRVKKSGYATLEKNKFSVGLVRGSDKNSPSREVAGNKGVLSLLAPPNNIVFVNGKEYREEKLTLNQLSPGSHIV